MSLSHPGLKRKDSERSVSPPAVKRKFQSNTTANTVASFFTPASQKPKATEKISWRTVNSTLLVAQYNASSALSEQVIKRREIAAFDFDSTLIKSASGNKFGKDGTDWTWWHPSVPDTIKRLYDDGFQIVVMSNQGGINLKEDPKSLKGDRKRLTDFKSKVNAVLNALDLPITLFAATEKDIYRKPRPGMWTELLALRNAEVLNSIDLDKSLFIGDAGGRVKTVRSPKDFSCSDRDFAANVSIKYQTPEEFFLHEDSIEFARTFDPTIYLKEKGDANNGGETVFTKRHDVDIVVLSGSPGAGKSTFFWTWLAPLGYHRINQDILKTREKCLKSAGEILSSGMSVAIDNTNADPETRAHWVKLAKGFNVPIRCVLFTAETALCEHNSVVRALGGSVTNPEARALLPKLAFTSFQSRFRAPSLDEGFEDIAVVNFEFAGEAERARVWSRYWV